MLRNFLFSATFFSGIVLISILFFPALLMPKSVVLFGGKLMGYWTSFCLRVIMNTKIEIIGKENLVKEDKFNATN